MWCYSEVNHDDRPLCAAYSLILEMSFLTHAEFKTDRHNKRHLGIYSFYWYTTSEEPMPHGVPFE